MFRLLHREGGASTIEMALITPLLMLLLVGLVDFGRVILAQIKLKDAVQEGAV